MTNSEQTHQPTDDDDVVDEATQDDVVAPEKYAISSFGIDFDVEGLVRRLRKEDIFVPHFQRNYVWKQAEASQFIESLLLGLPVPGVFLAKERGSQRLLIIDGQQRLKTLQFFYDGFFKPIAGEQKRKVFQLIDVQPQFSGKTYETISEEDRRRLDNSVLHATIIKQEAPAEDEDTSLYYIFGRLNTGGRKLTGQEIRSALYHGPFAELIEELNTTPQWRAIFGKENERLKDHELIVRFLALHFDSKKYQRPMEEFLNRFCARHQEGPAEFIEQCRKLFRDTLTIAHDSLSPRAFRPVRAINAAVFDALAVGLARRLAKGPITNPAALATAYQTLSANQQFVSATSRATADEANVATRIRLAAEAFDQVV